MLIVDDESLERKALKKMIYLHDTDVLMVEEAQNGRIAIELAREIRPDIIFMDIKMPGIDGVEAVKQIKRFAPKTKFIMVSAFDTFEYAREVMRQGVKEYILKPSRQMDVLDAFCRLKEEIIDEKLKQQEQKMLEDQLIRANHIANLLVNREKGVNQEEVHNHQHHHEKGLLYKAKEYIEEHYQEALSLEGVAENIKLSPYYFSKLFKEHFGLNFIDFLTEIRIDHAKRHMLDPEKSLKEICFEVGYKDPNYFSRVFKKYAGLSPSDYRKNNQI
ncbi:response regulator transcription factor [Bacillus sp. 1NLA3E]|uniref:response regulator transcription factor n=1 Tax=Bacillus sp. 1NLA3E TaxID=666686 RepID=UPI002E205694